MDSDDDVSEADANEEEFSESSESDIPSMSISLPSNTATIPESDNFEWERPVSSSVQPFEHQPPKPYDLFASLTPTGSPQSVATAAIESQPSVVVRKQATVEVVAPRKTINLFDDEPPELDTISVESRRKSPVNLFLDDDDDIVPANRPPIIKVPSPERQKPTQSDITSTMPKKTVNLFDDDDYDSFMNVLDKQTSKSKPTTKSTMASIFDDEPSDDLFDVLIARSTAPKRQQPKSGLLFDDDDVAEVSKMVIEKNVDTFLSSNRLLKEDPPPIEQKDTAPVSKPLLSKNIFDDNDDDDDYDKLFGGTTSSRVHEKPVDTFLSSNHLLKEDTIIDAPTPKLSIYTNLFDADDSDDRMDGTNTSRVVDKNRSSDIVDKGVSQQRRLFYDDYSNETDYDRLFGESSLGQPESAKDNSSQKAIVTLVDNKVDVEKSDSANHESRSVKLPIPTDTPKEAMKVMDEPSSSHNEPNIDYDKLFPKVNITQRADAKKKSESVVGQRNIFDDDEWTNEHDDLFGKMSSKTGVITSKYLPTKRPIASTKAPSTFQSFLDNDPLIPDDPISPIGSSSVRFFDTREQPCTVPQTAKKDEIDRSAAPESPIKNRLETLFAKANDVTGSIDRTEPEKPKPKKLVHNLNINVGALLPGAKRVTKAMSVPSNITYSEPLSTGDEQLKPAHTAADDDFKTPPPNENGNRLIGLTKSRAKFSGQRKSSTRRGRQEQYRKSVIQLHDDSEPTAEDPAAQIDEPKSPPSEILKSVVIAESLQHIDDDWLKVAATSPPDLFSDFLDAPPPLDDWYDNPPADLNNEPTFPPAAPSTVYYPTDSTVGHISHAIEEDDLLFGGPPPLHSIIDDDKLFDLPFDTTNSSFIEDDWQPSPKINSKSASAKPIHSNLFSDDDDDDGDDLFAVKMKPPSTNVAVIGEQQEGVTADVPAKAVSNNSLSFLDSASEDDGDLFGGGMRNETKPIVNRVKEKIKSGVGIKSGRLFDDDSDNDEDIDGDALFSSSKREPNFPQLCFMGF